MNPTKTLIKSNFTFDPCFYFIFNQLKNSLLLKEICKQKKKRRNKKEKNNETKKKKIISPLKNFN